MMPTVSDRDPPYLRSEPDQDFTDWFASNWARLVAAVTLETRDSHAAEDAVADAAAKLMRRWDAGSVSDPAGWVYRVAVRAARRARWRRSREPAEVGLVETADIYADPDLWRAIEALPARQRQAIVLRYLLDLTQADVARAMGVAPGTVAALLNQGRARLRSSEGLR
jgi:RNA polymerase sigma-70 factor, ECF subfamily